MSRYQPYRRAAKWSLGTVAFAKPKAIAMDYRSSASEFPGGVAFEQGATLTLHMKFPISILGMQPSQAALGAAGNLFVRAGLALDPAHVFGQYCIASQQRSSAEGAPTYAPIYNALDAGGTDSVSWWAKNAATGLKTKTGVALGFSSWEVNLCVAYTTPDSNSPPRRAAEAIAHGYHTLVFSLLYAAGVRLFFQDNVWGNPGGFTTQNTIDSASNDLGSLKVGDYTLDGVNDTRTNSDWATRNNAPNVEWRKGLANFSNKLKELSGAGMMSMANGDSDHITDATYGNSMLGTPEFTTGALDGGKVYDFGFIEGLTANAGSVNTSAMRSCMDAFRGNFANTLNRYYSQHDACRIGAVVGAYIKSTNESLSRTLQKCRYALGVSMLGDGYVAVADRLDGVQNMRPYWFNELDLPAGSPTEPRPTTSASGYGGCFKREHDNLLVIVNPCSNKGRWLQNAPGGATIIRSGGTVTLTWSGLAALRTWSAGSTKLRMVDSNQIGGSPTFDGTFTLATFNGTNQITWADARADSGLVTAPDGSLETLTTIDLTGQGWTRFLGTDDTHDDYLNGTSQNDGTTVTTIDLWSGDAVMLLKA